MFRSQEEIADAYAKKLMRARIAALKRGNRIMRKAVKKRGWKLAPRLVAKKSER